VGVNADRFLPEGVAEQDVGGFSADAGKRQKIIEIVGNFAIEPLDDLIATVVYRPRFITIEIDPADLLLQLWQRRARIILGRSVFLEKIDGQQVDEIIPGLGRQNKRDEQLQRASEIQVELGIRMGLFEPGDDLLDSGRLAMFRLWWTCACHFGFTPKYGSKVSGSGGGFKMDLKELRRLTLPKLRELAKQETDLKGVAGMEKEELIKAIAKAQGIAYDESLKDTNAIHAIKQDIRALKKQKAEILASSPDRKKLKRIQRKIKLEKRLTRHLAKEAKVAAARKAAQPAAPAAPAPEAPPAAAG
jgi:hypothetical protein